jgi:hypothetical protein
MKIQVTQQHIDAGQKGSCTKDPVALALKEATGKEVWASPSYLVWWEDEIRKNVATPFKVYEFMRAYDNNEPVKSFEFELEGA